MVSVSSSLKVALTCYTGSFEIIFSSPFTAYLNHKNILPAYSMSQQIYDKPLVSLFPLVRNACIFIGNGSLFTVQNGQCYHCGYQAFMCAVDRRCILSRVPLWRCASTLHNGFTVCTPYPPTPPCLLWRLLQRPWIVREVGGIFHSVSFCWVVS